MMPDTIAKETEWPARAWIMAGVGSLAGLAVHLLIDKLHYGTPVSGETLFRQAAAAGVIVATLSFLLTAERVRLSWSIAFAIIWGAVVALVGYSTGGYNRAGELGEFSFFASLLAVGIAAPLFQAMRDEGRRALPYEKVHGYAWTDAIIGAASMAFTGLTFILLFLLGSLFDAIGIDLLKELLREGWFGWMVAGAAFGAASAVLRERAPLLGTLQRLVMLVFSVLAPVLAFALGVYLVALPITGFGGLWKSGLPETPLLLSAAGFCFVFLNAIIGDSPDDRKPGRLWRATEIVLLFAVLPLGILAMVSMSLRVGQYGWTPERLWGVIASAVAIAFGIANWLSVVRQRGAFDVALREYQKWLAAGLCGVALFLALPIVDFGAVSTRSQLARLEGGKVKSAEFDWTALAFDFGPAGRRALERLKRTGDAEQKLLAGEALAGTNRYAMDRLQETATSAVKIRDKVRLLSPDIVLDEALLRQIAVIGNCTEDAQCALQRVSPNRLLLISVRGKARVVSTRLLDPEARSEDYFVDEPDDTPKNPEGVDLNSATIELRPVTRRQLYVNGQPVGDTVE